jgi:hypothetical protein
VEDIMNWMTWLALAAAINWVAPLLMFLYPLFMKLVFKDFVFKGFTGPFAKFALANKGVEPWHAKLWKDWGGVGCYGFMCYKDRDDTLDDAWVARTIVHEGAHCWQFLILGLLQPVLYLGHSVFILIFQKSKHPYLDNWFERAARKKAGQRVDIPRTEWPQGPRDRWPWW